MPRLKMIRSPSSSAKQKTVVGNRNELSSTQSQRAQTAPKPVSSQQKTDTVTSSTATAIYQESASGVLDDYKVGVMSQLSSPSCRKHRWNMLVHKSTTLPLSSDNDIRAASAAATKAARCCENETTATKVLSAEHSDTTESCSNAQRHLISCQTHSTTSSWPSSGLVDESERDCESHYKYQCWSPQSSSSLSSSSNTACTTPFSTSPSPPRKTVRLNATATKCGRRQDDDFYQFDHCRSRCCSRVLYGCHCSRRRYTCEHERCHYYDEKLHGAQPSSNRQSARQFSADQSPVNVAPTEQYVFRRRPTAFISSPCIHQTAGTAHDTQTAKVFGLGQPFISTLPIEQDSSNDNFNARLFAADRRNCCVPSLSTSPPFVTFANSTSNVRSSSTFGDRPIVTSVESCSIPLEPVNGVPIPVDPRRLPRRQLTANVTTDVDEPSKVNHDSLTIQDKLF